MIPSILFLTERNIPEEWSWVENKQDFLRYDHQDYELVIESNGDYVTTLYRESKQLRERCHDHALDAALTALGMMNNPARVEQYVLERE